MTAQRAKILADARAARSRVGVHLSKYHAQRSYTEVMRDCRAALDECIRELEQETPEPQG